MSRTLHDGWQVASTPLHAIEHPDALASLPSAAWRDAVVPGSVAASLLDPAHRSATGRDGLGAVDVWDTDWWFRTTCSLPDGGDGRVLRFDGLATRATVFVDGHVVAEHHTALRALDIALDGLDAGDHDLAVVCRGLASFDGPSRPRQRWRTRLVPDARLRWIRTPLFGHMPGWTPPWPVVGPYREVRVLEPHDDERIAAGASWSADADGTVCWRLDAAVGVDVSGARVRVGDTTTDVDLRDGRALGHGSAAVDRWWPHTHGTPALHPLMLELTMDDGSRRSVELGRVGARTIEVDTDGGAFRLRVNGVPVFARGAVWTPLDAARAWAEPDALRRAVEQLRDAGCNIVRLPGIGLPEQLALHHLCDELGVLVWVDLLYANFDLPFDDPAFGDEARRETGERLRSLARHASTAVVCGGSEIHQQAAMYGVARDGRHVPFLEDELPRLVADAGLDVPVVPSTPWGGGLPFQVDTGVSHYYGVGAYRRPLDDVRHAGVRFTTECLAFSHVPAAETLDVWTGGEQLPAHDPRWKARVPRDRGAGWDFEDTRDHYVRLLSGTEPADVRSYDIGRSLDLGRAATAEAVDAALRELRRPGGTCDGALVFTLRDPWHGAGWGYVDVTGRPKSAWYVLARRFAARAVWCTDEGLSGLGVHVANDLPEPLDATLLVQVTGRSGRPIDEVSVPVHVPGHGTLSHETTELFDSFHDLTWAYRFGPLAHVAVVATLVDADGRRVSTDVWTPTSALAATASEPDLQATAVSVDDDRVVVDVSTVGFAPWVHLVAPGWLPDDDWFHLAPCSTHRVTLRPLGPEVPTHHTIGVRSLASTHPVSVRLPVPCTS